MARVLVVDDSHSMRELVSYVLTNLERHEVDTAVDGLDGFKKLLSGSYDLVITEVYMPVMDGFKLIRLIRNDPRHDSKPVIVLTRESDASVEEKAREAGAELCLHKPIQAPDVITAVRRLLVKRTDP